jgi:uncharacterized protein (TIGR03083 family)
MSALRQHFDVWKSSCADFSVVAHQLTDEQWALPTDCAGWSVGDVVAHAAALESELAGDEPLRVTIDKEAPHVKNSAGVYTERGVVARRGRTPSPERHGPGPLRPSCQSGMSARVSTTA